MYSFRRNVNALSSPSPISSLPVELLSEIFSLCVLSTDGNSDDREYSPPAITSESIRIPLVLSSVNRRWREVALNQSSLWSNICITPELIDSLFDNRSPGYSSSAKLNPTHIITYLSRSRHYPLNILIDGRDPDWDFSEPDVGIDFGTSTFSTLFSAHHMSDAISLLVPHISRWKSLTILTDTWEPMHTALSLMNPALMQFGAPFLESMSLMRCNDYVSFSRRFQPRHLRDLAFLTPTSSYSRTNILPRLKHLSLRGVHADWNSLGDALIDSSLSTLELASHPKDVRPSMNQFHKLIKSNPALRSLSIVGTGPEGPGSEEDSAHNYESIYLPDLQDITVGYRTETGARSLFHFIDASNARCLTLEDTSYPADPFEVNAGPILSYLGTKQCDGNEHRLESSEQPVEVQEKRRKRSICAFRSEVEAPKLIPTAFPCLEEVTLRNVKSSFPPLATFIRSLSNVKHLELVNMSMLAIKALVPYSTSTAALSCPCPKLHSLSIKDSELRVQDLDFIVCRLSTYRQSMGARDLEQLDIHVDPSRLGDVHLIAAAAAASPDSKVNIISDSESESDSDGDSSVFDEEDEEAAFRPGGAFNDPEFDAYYSAGIAAH